MRHAAILPVAGASEEAQAALDATIMGYVNYESDTGRRLAALLELHPGLGLAHALKGYFWMLTFKLANVAPAREALTQAQRLTIKAPAREQAHVAALGHWIDGDLDSMLGVWEEILAEHPTDILALRLHHFNAFWLGRPAVMASAAERVLPSWSPQQPGYGALLACRAFAHEELGNYALAEASGRRAIDLDPSDVWAAHAVAHVLEMQGRRAEGIAWLEQLEPHWTGKNNLTHHLWWHRGLYHLERGEYDAVLELYDHRFRNPASPLTQAQPDLYIDVQNAASMLFRLQRLGIDVGSRWVEIADKAETRTGDHLSAFTQPHWMMALAATERWDAAAGMLAAMSAFGNEGKGALAAQVRDFACPVSEAVLLHGRANFAAALDRMRPVLGGMGCLGGSHAQQDVLEQLFLDCAVKAGREKDVRLILERVRARHPVALEERAGYRDALPMLH